MENNKFENVPVDEDTKIKSRSYGRIGELDYMHEKWVWEGISGESIVFADFEVDKLRDSELIALVSELDIVTNKGRFTVRRSKSGYTFVNFNFYTF